MNAKLIILIDIHKLDSVRALKYRRRKGHKRKISGRTLIPNRISIHQRPIEADGTRFGGGEMDLVIGKGQKSAVLTMVERKTNMFLQGKLTSKKPEIVAMAAWRLLLPYRTNVLTITLIMALSL